MNVIFEKPYDYLLIEEDKIFYLTFFSGGPVEIDICVRLTEDEALVASQSAEDVERLVKKFKTDRAIYSGRRVIPAKHPGLHP